MLRTKQSVNLKAKRFQLIRTADGCRIVDTDAETTPIVVTVIREYAVTLCSAMNEAHERFRLKPAKKV